MRVYTMLVLPAMTLSLVIILTSTSFAQSFTWIGGGINNNWSTDPNWSGLNPPVSGINTIVQYSATGGANTISNQDLQTEFLLNRISFLSGGNAISVRGNALRFADDSTGNLPQITNASINPNEIRSNLIFQSTVITTSSGGRIDLLGQLSGINGIRHQAGVLQIDPNAGSGSNTYAGITEVLGGTLLNGRSDALPTNNTVHVRGGTWELNDNNQSITSLNVGPRSGSQGFVNTGTGTLTVNGNIDIIPSTPMTEPTATINGLLQLTNANPVLAGTRNSGAAYDLRVNANISGNGFTKNGDFAMVLAGTNSMNGTVTVNQGTVYLNHDQALSTSNRLVVNSGAFVTTQSWDNIGLGNNVTVGSIQGSGFINLFGSNVPTFRMGGDNTPFTFNGIFQQQGQVIKEGTDVATLTGNSNHQGGVLVSNGTLLVNNTAGSGTGSGLVQVSNSAVVGGTGTIGGSVTIDNGGSIAPGASAGVLTINSSFTLNPSSILNFELGTVSDSINVNGNLTLDGILNLTALTGFGQGTYTLIDYAGSLTDNGLAFGSTPTGFDYSFSNDLVNTQILLNVTAVPEPATIALISLALCGVGGAWYWRRKKKLESESMILD